jgi:hypothetical protein
VDLAQSAEAHVGVATAVATSEEDASEAEARGVLLPRHGILRSTATPSDGAAPSIPAMFLLPAAASTEWQPAEQEAQAGGGSSCRCAQPGAPQPALGHATLLGFPGSCEAESIDLDLTPDCLVEAGGMAMLAGSTCQPALAVCSLHGGLTQQDSTAALPLPEDVPEGSSVRVRGLAAAAEGGQVHVWALLAATPKLAPPPFMGAALTRSGYLAAAPSRVWLCCYRLPPGMLAGVNNGGVSARTRQAVTAAEPPAGVPPVVVHAVCALQRAVADTRRELNARLDALEAQLATLLQQVQPSL